MEKTSSQFAIKYLLGIINSSVARNFLHSNRRSNIHLYPDDWKKLPIPDVPMDKQVPIEGKDRATTQGLPLHMIYDHDIHHRRSIRLKGYNYSEAGAYFVTICTQNKECLFGEIVEGKINMNSAGEMI